MACHARRLEIFYIGSDTAIYHNFQVAAGSGAWAGEKIFGGYAKQLAICPNSDGRLELFYIGTNHDLYHNWQLVPNGNWAGETAIDGQANFVAGGMNSDGRLEIFYTEYVPPSPGNSPGFEWELPQPPPPPSWDF